MKSSGLSMLVTACAGLTVAACSGKLIIGTTSDRTVPDGGSAGSSGSGGAGGFGGFPKSGQANGGKQASDGGGGGTGTGAFSGSTGDAAAGGAVADGAAGSSTVEGGVPSNPTAPWWPHRTAVGCQSAGVPLDTDRVKSDSDDNIGPIYLAMNRVRIGAVDEARDPRNDTIMLVPDPNAWKTIGFDIDGKCTRSATCQMQDELVDERACANAQTVSFDGDKCVDNAIGNLFNIAASSPSLETWFGVSEADWNCEMWRGGFSVVLKISDYNGQYNDDSVQVDLYTSIGLNVLPAWTCRQSIDQPVDPNWNTHAPWPTKMHWIISEDSIDPSARPIATDVPDSKWRDVSAFVRGGWLVARFPDGSSLWFDGERTSVPGLRQIMHRSVVAMQLVKNPQTNLWTMENGTLAFATTPGELLAGFAQIGFCENMCGTFATLRDYAFTYQDTVSLGGNAPATTKCDALSYGMTFRGAQISADATDVQPTAPATACPQPRHPAAPRQNCRCSPNGGTCTGADAGN